MCLANLNRNQRNRFFSKSNLSKAPHTLTFTYEYQTNLEISISIMLKGCWYLATNMDRILIVCFICAIYFLPLVLGSKLEHWIHPSIEGSIQPEALSSAAVRNGKLFWSVRNSMDNIFENDLSEMFLFLDNFYNHKCSFRLYLLLHLSSSHFDNLW